MFRRSEVANQNGQRTDNARDWAIKMHAGMAICDKIHQLLVKGATVKGVGLRERWRAVDGKWVRSRFKYVVQRMRWEKRNGRFHGVFEWVRYRRGREWQKGWNQGFLSPSTYLRSSVVESGISHAMPQEILLFMVYEAVFVSVCTLRSDVHYISCHRIGRRFSVCLWPAVPGSRC